MAKTLSAGSSVTFESLYEKGNPPPRFSSFLTGELLPYVEAHFPTSTGRAWRALAGTSLGGYGSYKNGLQHPDVWSSMGSVSGAHNFLFGPGVDPSAVSSPEFLPACSAYRLTAFTSAVRSSAAASAAKV